jgi:hypothetical protein
MLRMRRDSSVPPASATVVANPAARLIALPMIKVRRDEGLSSSQYLENQSGSGPKGPRHAGGTTGLSSGGDLPVRVVVDIFPLRSAGQRDVLIKTR